MGMGRGAGDRPENEVELGQAQGYANEQTRQRDNAFRYQQKLAQDQQQQQGQRFGQQLPNQPLSQIDGLQPGPSPAGGQLNNPAATPQPGTAGGANLDFNFNNRSFNAQVPQMGGFDAQNATGGAPAPSTPLQPTGLASLDIDVPARGQVFLFTMPRGEIEITARPYSWDLLTRLINLGVIAALIAVGVVLYRIGSSLVVRQATGTLAFAMLLIVLGLGSLLFGFLPNFGGLLILIGFVLVVRRLLDQRRAVVAPAATTAT